MKALFTLFSFWTIFSITNLAGQSGCDEPFDSPRCSVSCNFISGSSGPYSPGTPGPTYPCGSTENNQWFNMIAVDSSITVEYMIYNCQNMQGLQLLIYDLDLQPVSECSGGVNDFSGSIVADSLTPGNTYLLMIDGFAGDICSFDLVIRGIQYGNGAPVRMAKPISEENGLSQVCKETIVCYSTDTISGADFYQWDFSLPVEIISGEGEKDICVRYLESGFDTISLLVLYDCKESLPVNHTIEVIDAPITDLGVIELCENEYPFIFNGKSFDGPGDYTEAFITGNSCDSVVSFELKTLPIEAIILREEICAGSEFQFRDKIYSEAGLYIYETDYGPGSICDSVFFITLEVLPPLLTEFEIDICDNEEFIFNGEQVTASGAYFDTLATPSGCDSILKYNVFIRPTSQTIIDTSVEANTIILNRLIINDTSFSIQYTKSNGCDSTVVYIVDVGPSNTYNLELQNSISIFPNPLAEVLFISLPKDAPKLLEIEIFNGLGSKVLSIKQSQFIQSPTGEIQLNVSTLSKSFYFLKMKFEGGEFIGKRLVKT